MNCLPISHFMLKKILGMPAQLQEFPPTLGTILGDAYTPEASPFQHILLNPGHPD